MLGPVLGACADRPSCRRPDRVAPLVGAGVAGGDGDDWRSCRGHGGRSATSGSIPIGVYSTLDGYTRMASMRTKQDATLKSGSAASRARCAASPAWSRTTAIASTSSPRSPPCARRCSRVEEEVLRDHVAHCVEHAIASGDKDEQRQKIAELMDVWAAPSASRSYRVDSPRIAIGGAGAEECGKDRHHADPADPGPTRAWRDIAKREHDQRRTMTMRAMRSKIPTLADMEASLDLVRQSRRANRRL